SQVPSRPAGRLRICSPTRSPMLASSRPLEAITALRSRTPQCGVASARGSSCPRYRPPPRLIASEASALIWLSAARAYAEALAASEQWAIQSGALRVHAFDQVETLLGQGTVGLEL